jgi:serine/threonine-protein kinase SRK2
VLRVQDKWQHAQQTGLFLSEDEARYYFRQFVTAVAYCHAHNVAHRCAVLMFHPAQPPS